MKGSTDNVKPALFLSDLVCDLFHLMQISEVTLYKCDVGRWNSLFYLFDRFIPMLAFP